tara:strand:- start:35845 stop:37470 length:1626 start_codon:yes stop_codon:yes gene_type:complete
MKKIIASMLLTSIIHFAFATEKEVKSKIKNVTVFLTGAEINRSANVSLSSGNQIIVLKDLSQYIDANTIQVSGIGNFIILGVDYRRNYINTSKNSPEMKKLQDSLKFYNEHIEENTQLLDVYNNEKQMILANKVLNGENVSFEPAKLAELSNFYRTRLKDINLKSLALNRKNKHYTNRARVLSRQINELSNKGNTTTGEILVTVAAKSATNGTLNVKYKVSNAGWVPSYDIRSKSLNEKIQISYKASLYQNTGVDWKNINITFSTGNPNLSNTQPELYPWYLQYYNAYKKRARSKTLSSGYNNAPQMQSLEIADDEEYESTSYEQKADSISSFTKTVNNLVNSEFKLGMPLTVKSDGKSQLLILDEHQLDAQYKYYTVPKLDKNAFLIAKITGWEELSLLPGEINLYNAGTYVGKSYLDPSETQDTLEISLGRDQSIVLDRKTIKDFCKNQVVGGNRKITKAYEIIVRNPKPEQLEIEILDQIPLSKNSDIVVSADEISGGKLDEKTGFVTWKLTLKPKESKKLMLKFTVKYPKDKRLSNL